MHNWLLTLRQRLTSTEKVPIEANRTSSGFADRYNVPGPARKRSSLRFSINTLLLLTAIIAVLLEGVVSVRAAIQTRVIASVDHTNGTRLRVIQYFNYQPELFTTSIYFDDGDGKWRWYYFDHQDSYWGHADAEIDGSRILVTSRLRRIDFDTSTGECTTFHCGRHHHLDKSDRIEPLPGKVDRPSSPRALREMDPAHKMPSW